MPGRGVLRWALLAIVLGYVGLTLVVTDLSLSLAYDEAIYLSQVYPGPTLPFTAPRARGLPLLLAPLGWFDAPTEVIRGYLLAVEAGLMYLGFNAWLPVLRGRAVIAAAAFGVGWLPLFYGVAAFPNLPVAFGAVAATGYLARYLQGKSGRRALVACAAAITLIALIRPTEAAFIVAALGMVTVTRRGRELALRWGLLAGGLALGWVPWVIEAYQRFGGPRQRFRAASTNVGGGFHPENIHQQLGLTDGPTTATIREGVPWAGVLWWSLIALAVAVLLVRVLIGQSDRGERAGAIAAVVGVVTAAQYLLLTDVQEARFLLPAYAVLTVAVVAAGPTPAALRRSAHRRAGRAASVMLVIVLLAVFAVFAGWQVAVVNRVTAEQVAARSLVDDLTAAIQRRTAPPCAVAAEVAFPVIAFEAGCRGAPFRPDSPDITVQVGSDRSPLPLVYVLTSTNPARTGVRPIPGSITKLAAEGAPRWWLFIADPQQVVTTS